MALSKPAADANMTCWLCGLKFTASEGRLHGKKFTCGICSSAHRTMRRTCGEIPQEVQSFSGEEVCEFYRSLHEKKQSKGELTWQTIKATLIHTAVTRHTSSSRESLVGEWLPLSVWLSRGWPDKTVLQQESKYNEGYGCDCYKIPVQVESWDEVHERVTQSLLNQEQNGTKAKGKKGLEDLDVPVAQSTKEPKAVSAAGKAVGAWTRGLTQLEKVESKVRGMSDMPAGSVETYDDILQKLRGHTVAAKASLTAFEKNKSKALLEKEELSSLPFDAGDVKVLQKQAVEVLKDIRNQFPKPAPKEKATPAAKAGQKRKSGPQPAAVAEGEPARRRSRKTPA